MAPTSSNLFVDVYLYMCRLLLIPTTMYSSKKGDILFGVPCVSTLNASCNCFVY
eukprot:UN05117